MQRAAAGLARRCAALLADRGGVYGRRVLLLVGAGDNGGDALFAGAALARRGAAVPALLLTPDRAHPEGLAALRAAGGSVVGPLTADSVTWSSTASSASARRVGCGAPPRRWSRALADASTDRRRADRGRERGRAERRRCGLRGGRAARRCGPTSR